MSFEVFRRHQKKLLAVFAIMAMFIFVVSDSLPRWLNSSTIGRDQLVVKLYDSKIYQSQVNEMKAERSLANQFVSRMFPYYGDNPFGSLETRDLVDAIILQHEADRLGIPTGTEVGKAYLKQVTQGRMNGEFFHALMGDLSNRVSDEQVLSAIANQVRLTYVRGEAYSLIGRLFLPGRLIGDPPVTPYDIFRAYRDENERVSAKLVDVPVEKFVAKVSEPTAQEVQAYYDTYKDVLPDPSRPTPGFKVPRQVQVEILSIDGKGLARGIKDRLSEDELRAAYENRKSEYPIPRRSDDLPDDLFAGHPELTPPAIQPYSDVRPILALSLAEQKAQNDIIDKFERIKKDELDRFFDTYQDALDHQEELRKQGSRSIPVLPQPADLKRLAQRETLDYEVSPMLSREDAERYGQIHDAKIGMTRGIGGKTFTEEFFDPKTPLYEPVELTDLLGRRYLARKLQDAAPRVPPLDEVRSQVAVAWKIEKARPLAQKAADQVAEQLKKQGGAPKDPRFQGYAVVPIPPIARKRTLPNLNANSFQMGPPEDSPISEVPFPGQALREAYFSLQPGAVAVVANQPKTTYYAMTLDRREPATFTALYSPAGEAFRYTRASKDQAYRQLVENWMSSLRRQAGMDPNWVPPEEARQKEGENNRG